MNGHSSLAFLRASAVAFLPKLRAMKARVPAARKASAGRVEDIEQLFLRHPAVSGLHVLHDVVPGESQDMLPRPPGGGLSDLIVL